VVKLAKYQTKVKCYQRKKSKQYLITLTGNHGFKGDEPVTIISKPEFEELENISDSRKNQISDLESQLAQLEQEKTQKAKEMDNQLKIYKDKVQNLENDVTEFKEIAAGSDTKVQNLEHELSTSRLKIKELELMEEKASKFDRLQDDHNRLRNKHDHIQERLRKALEEVNQQQKVISDLSNRGFVDYITGRLPLSYKQLNEPKK
jgi:chromosome segregation ATPase